jgi:hypothetical protein
VTGIIPILTANEAAQAARNVARSAREAEQLITEDPGFLGLVSSAFETFANEIENATPQFNESSLHTVAGRPRTSELLGKAAQLINDLMTGRGVDRMNGFNWWEFVSNLRERAAAFKAIEDTP